MTGRGKGSDPPVRVGGKGRTWSEDDDVLLRRLINGREPPARIARALHRTLDAVRGRAAQLHLTLPSPLRPWRRFPSPNARTGAGEQLSTIDDHDTGGPASEGDP